MAACQNYCLLALHHPPAGLGEAELKEYPGCRVTEVTEPAVEGRAAEG